MESESSHNNNKMDGSSKITNKESVHQFSNTLNTGLIQNSQRNKSYPDTTVRTTTELLTSSIGTIDTTNVTDKEGCRSCSDEELLPNSSMVKAEGEFRLSNFACILLNRG